MGGLGLDFLVLGGDGIGWVWLGGWGRWVGGGADLEAREEFAAFGISKVIHGPGDSLDLAAPTILVNHGLPDHELDFVVVARWRDIFSVGQVERGSHLIEGYLEEFAARWDPRWFKDGVEGGLHLEVAVHASCNLTGKWGGHAGGIELVQAGLHVGATGAADFDQAGHQGVGGGVDDSGFSVGLGFVVRHGFAGFAAASNSGVGARQ